MKKQSFTFLSLLTAIIVLLSSYKKETLTQSTRTIKVPAALKTNANEILVASYYGIGTQNYEAQADPVNPSQAKWVFIEPIANLYDAKGKLIILHSKGPLWQCIADGSTVTGSAIVSVPAEVPSQNIPQLLLSNKTNTGNGLFTNVNLIQRLDTKGGIAPTTPPTIAMIGTIIKVPYSALYNFYKKK